MSVIVLSSEDEDDCYVIEKEGEEPPASLHQVFIPECNPDDFEKVPEQRGVDAGEVFIEQLSKTIIYYGQDDKVDFDTFESELEHGNVEKTSTQHLQDNSDCSSKEQYRHETCPDAFTLIDVNVVNCNSVSSSDGVKKVGKDANKLKLKFIAETLSTLLRDTEHSIASEQKTLKNRTNATSTEKSPSFLTSKIINQNRKPKNNVRKSESRLEKVGSKKAYDKLEPGVYFNSCEARKPGIKQPPNVKPNSFTKCDLGGSDGVNQNSESENNQGTSYEQCQSRLTNIKKKFVTNDTETDSEKKLLGRKRGRPKTTKTKTIHEKNGDVANVPKIDKPKKKKNVKSTANITNSKSHSCKAIAEKALSTGNILGQYFINNDTADYIRNIVKSTLNEMLGSNTNLGMQSACIEKVCLNKVTQSMANSVEISEGIDKEIANKIGDTPNIHSTTSPIQSKSSLNEDCQEVHHKSREEDDKEIFSSVEKETTIEPVENNITDGIEESYPNTLSNTDCCGDNMKEDFVTFYHIVFNDEVEYLCMAMGDLLLLAMTESANCKDRLMKANKFTCDQLKQKEVTIAMTCYRKNLIQYRNGFADPFKKLLRILSGEKAVSPVQHRALLIAWFLKLFLRVTSLSPEFSDSLHDAKLNVISLLSVEALKAHSVTSVFVRNETEFESDCWLVLDFMQACFEPDSGQNSDESIDHNNKDTVAANEANLIRDNLDKTDSLPLHVSASNELREQSTTESPQKILSDNVNTGIHNNNTVQSSFNTSEYQSGIQDLPTKRNWDETNRLPHLDASTLNILGDQSSIQSCNKTSVDNIHRNTVLPPSNPAQSDFNRPEYYSVIQHSSTNRIPDQNRCMRLEDHHRPQTHPVQVPNATVMSTGSSYSPTKIPQQGVIIDPYHRYPIPYPLNISNVNERLAVQGKDRHEGFSAFGGKKRHPNFESNKRKAQRTDHANMYYNQGQQNQQSPVYQMSGYPHTGNVVSTNQCVSDSGTLSEKGAILGVATQPYRYGDMLYYQAKQSILRHTLSTGRKEVAGPISNPQNLNQYPFVPNRMQQFNPPRYQTPVNANKGSYRAPNAVRRGNPPYPRGIQNRFVQPDKWPYYQQGHRNINPPVYNGPTFQPRQMFKQNVNSNSLTGPPPYDRREDLLNKQVPGVHPFSTSHSAPSALITKEYSNQQEPKLPKYNIDGRLNSVETSPEFEVSLESPQGITRPAGVTINNYNYNTFIPPSYTDQLNYGFMVEKYGPLNRREK